MGITAPYYNIDERVITQIQQIINSVKTDNFSADRQKAITYRPLRPDELNQSLSVNTRVYDTTKTGTGFERILGATSDPTVKTGSIYVIYGWIVIDDPTASIGMDAVARILVDGVLRNEICPYLATQSDNNILVTLDQVVVLTEDTTFTIEFNSPSNASAHAIVYPLGVRIGPKAQLDVS